MRPAEDVGPAPPRSHRLLLGALGVLALYLAPWIVLGRDAPVLIHDNLDSNVLWYEILARSGLVFAPNDTVVPDLLGGVPRSAFGSEWNVQLWLYVLFEPFTAGLWNQLLMRVAALFGAFLLLRRHVLPRDEPHAEAIAVGCGLCFALLPFWPSGGLSIAGQPLLLHALLNVRRGSARAADWAVIVLMPFYSYLVVAGVFFLAALGIFALGDAARSRRLHGPFLAAIALHGVLLLGVEYRLLLSVLGGDGFVSHRTEFAPGLVEGREALAAAWKLLRQGQYHAASLHAPVIAATVLLATVVGVRDRATLRPLLACLAAVLGIAAIYGLHRWQGFADARALLSLGVGFKTERFYTLLPLISVVAFALALAVVCRATRRGPWFAAALVACQVAIAFLHGDVVEEQIDHGISWRRFFAEEQFAEIAAEIGRPQDDYRVASLGLHPSIAQAAGFRTADGYFPNYPLSHKHALRQAMRAELAKDPELARYYDEWGNRAYLFSAELGKRFVHPGSEPRMVRDLRLDARALAALEVEFLLSAAELAEPGTSGLEHVRTFVHPDSAWHVYLYRRREADAPPANAWPY